MKAIRDKSQDYLDTFFNVFFCAQKFLLKFILNVSQIEINEEKYDKLTKKVEKAEIYVLELNKNLLVSMLKFISSFERV